ncbi:hypothetical protein D1013_00380 [Euzebyella marina]|uniref:Uncharacterized protein n=1 Tax=Euzebyella marina TaxID=1761453 RepID=A0A3G2L114_9FLAO|nr:hypothetical protein [Euzebyella marina]AYN65944.1 hypothetical protein D1013_00380 [Euzebyella marina]
MLKAFVPLLVGILLSYSVFKNHSKKKSSKFIEYTSLIQKGESDILDDKFKEAFEKYERALSHIDKPLAADCFTALQLAALLKKNEEFTTYLGSAFSSGLEPKDLKKDSLLSSFISDNKLDKIVSFKFKKFRKVYSQNLNRFLMDTIEKMSNYDNRWKVHYIDSLSYVDNENKEIYHQKYDSIISNLVENKLMPLISEYGYPGERKIGVQKLISRSEPLDYTFINNSTLFILLHYYGYAKSCQYNELLYSEMQKGNLKPEHYASIIDFQAKFGESKFCRVGYYNQWHQTGDSTKFFSINERRAKIGLANFENIKRMFDRGLNICRETDKGNYKHIKLFYWCG